MRLQDVSYCFVLHVMILLRAEIRLTSWYGRYPIIYRVFSTIPGGSPDFSHQQYDLPFGKARPSVALSEEGLRRKATYIHKLESILAWNFTRTPWRIHGKMVYLHEWLIFFGNLGEYTIHWWYGKWIQPESYEHDDLFFGECKFPCWLMRGRTLPVQFFSPGFWMRVELDNMSQPNNQRHVGNTATVPRHFQCGGWKSGWFVEWRRTVPWTHFRRFTFRVAKGQPNDSLEKNDLGGLGKPHISQHREWVFIKTPCPMLQTCRDRIWWNEMLSSKILINCKVETNATKHGGLRGWNSFQCTRDHGNLRFVTPGNQPPPARNSRPY